MANKFVIIPIILCKVVHLAATLALAIMISMTYFSNGLFMSIFGNQDYTDELVLSFRLLLLLALVISGLTFLSNISGVITMSTKKHKLLNFNRVTLILFTLIHAIAGVAIMFYILPTTRKDFGLFLDRMVLSINSNHQYSSSCELMKGISTAYECCGGRFFNGSLDIISQLDADACCTKATDITDPSNIGCIEETFQTIEKDAIFIVIPFGVMILMEIIEFLYFCTLKKPENECECSEDENVESAKKDKKDTKEVKKVSKKDDKADKKEKKKGNKVKPAKTTDEVELAEIQEKKGETKKQFKPKRMTVYDY